jgi:1,4-dihydroxy-2-naphthoate polyprenyltransferase
MTAPASATTPAVSPSRAWLLAIRPQTLPAAVAPVLVGLGAAVGLGTPLRLDTAIGALAVALLLQVVANLANDLSDFRKGADTPDRQGPLRVAAAGLITPRRLEVAIALVIGAAGIVGLYLVWVGGAVLLLLGGSAILAALAYTGGPFPYGYKGMGEVFVFLFFGLVAVAGTAYLQSLTLEPLYVAAAVPVGALITAILVVNNLRDIETDRRAGKITLAVRLGRRGTQIEFLLLLVVAYTTLLVLWGRSGNTWLLLPFLTLPLAVRLWQTISTHADGPTLNAALAGTARLSLLFSLALAGGLLL